MITNRQNRVVWEIDVYIDIKSEKFHISLWLYNLSVTAQQNVNQTLVVIF